MGRLMHYDARLHVKWVRRVVPDLAGPTLHTDELSRPAARLVPGVGAMPKSGGHVEPRLKGVCRASLGQQKAPGHKDGNILLFRYQHGLIVFAFAVRAGPRSRQGAVQSMLLKCDLLQRQTPFRVRALERLDDDL